MRKLSFNGSTEIKQIPLDKITLKFFDPDTAAEIIVPVIQIVVGKIADYKSINSHSYVYDKENGYITIQTADAVLIQRLEPSQIKIIDAVLSEKQLLETQRLQQESFG